MRVGRLANDITVPDIVHRITSLGFQTVGDDVSLLPDLHNGFRLADVVSNEREFATKLTQALRTNANSHHAASPVLSPMFRATRYNVVEATRVECSWHKPVRVAWLNFATETNAAGIFRQFAEGAGRVCGHRVRAERPLRNDGVNAQTWRVKLTQVPAQAGRTDVASELNPSHRPLHIEVSAPTYDTSPTEAFEELELMLTGIGPLDWSGALPETVGRRFKYIGRYLDEEHAAAAVKRLNNRPLPFYGFGKLTVQALYSTRIKIAQYIYEAASRDIDALVRYSAAQYVNFTVHPPLRGFRHIQIEGQAKDMVTSAKDALSRVLDGELVTEEGNPVWSASFATNGWAYQQVKKLGRDLHILVLRDKRKCQLRLFGLRENFGTARVQIVEIAASDPRSTWNIALHAETFKWALSGGTRIITKTLGEDKVALDIVSSQRRLIVSGSQADHSLAMDILNRKEAAVSKLLELEPGSCAICWAQAEHAVETSCGHSFCVACFEDMCFSCTTVSSAEPGIRCYGEFGNCSKVLPLSDVGENLSSAALDQVLDRMLTAFMASDPLHYRYCPTPKCEQIYRLPKDAGTKSEEQDWQRDFEFTCPYCLVALCAACHVSHDTVKCPRPQG